jgi:hypothetical protein
MTSDAGVQTDSEVPAREIATPGPGMVISDCAPTRIFARDRECFVLSTSRQLQKEAFTAGIRSQLLRTCVRSDVFAILSSCQDQTQGRSPPTGAIGRWRSLGHREQVRDTTPRPMPLMQRAATFRAKAAVSSKSRDETGQFAPKTRSRPATIHAVPEADRHLRSRGTAGIAGRPRREFGAMQRPHSQTAPMVFRKGCDVLVRGSHFDQLGVVAITP